MPSVVCRARVNRPELIRVALPLERTNHARLAPLFESDPRRYRRVLLHSWSSTLPAKLVPAAHHSGVNTSTAANGEQPWTTIDLSLLYRGEHGVGDLAEDRIDDVLDVTLIKVGVLGGKPRLQSLQCRVGKRQVR